LATACQGNDRAIPLLSRPPQSDPGSVGTAGPTLLTPSAASIVDSAPAPQRLNTSRTSASCGPLARGPAGLICSSFRDRKTEPLVCYLTRTTRLLTTMFVTLPCLGEAGKLKS
jgi:hypothetical protein